MHFENQKPQLTHCYQVTNLTYALMVTLCYGNLFIFFSCIYFLATSHEYVADGSRCAIPCCVFRMAETREIVSCTQGVTSLRDRRGNSVPGGQCGQVNL